MQFQGPVLESWKADVSATGAELLDYVPDFAFKVRMNPGQATRVEQLPPVVWVGVFHPGFKLAAALVRDGRRAYRVRIERGADVDLAVSAVQAIGAQILERNGLVLTVSADGAQLDLLAQVLDVASIENFLLPGKLNEFGGGVIIGAHAANAGGFDGSTQTIAVADTGLGGGTAASGHPHITATRVAGLFNRPGSAGGCFTSVVDDGLVDVDTGHGTHTTTSAVGGGGPSGEGRGAAPAASLVFQAVENWATVSLFCGLFGATDGYYLTGIPSDLNVLFQQAYDAGGRIHSNSWGSAAAGAYTLDAVNADAFVWNHRDMTIAFAAGNSGTDADSDGIVDGGSLGSPATAKNVISIGASENDRELHWECDPNLSDTPCAAHGGQNEIFTYGDTWPTRFAANPLKDDPSAGNGDQMASFSSRGPTQDGRIKPDVVAPGTWVLSGYSSQFQQGYGPSPNPQNGQFQYDGWGVPASSHYKYMGGTSMAAPLVAGAAAVVRDFYQKTVGHEASAALVKATLVNSAVDLLDENNDGVSDNAHPIPNGHEGWGLVNLAAATDGDREFVDEAAALSTSTSLAYAFTVDATGSRFKVTLAWSDYPGTVSAAPALVNDLDLRVTAPDGTIYFGNVFGGGWSQQGGTPDRLNNLENVFVDVAQPGAWTVEVLAFNVPVGPQPFALVVDGRLDGPGTDLPSVMVTTVAPVAPEAGPVAGELLVSRSGDLASPLVVPYFVAGTATPGVDYEALTGTVTFDAGVSDATIAVTPLDDAIVESDETVIVTITPGSTYSIGTPPDGTVTIESDDAPPDLVVTAWATPSASGPGELVTVSDTTANRGGGPSAPSSTGFYLSTNTIVDSSDVLLGSRVVPGLAVNEGHSASTELSIPAETTPGTYRLIAVADVDHEMTEESEQNNALVSATVSIGADLAVSSLTIPGTAAAGGTLDVTDTTANGGGGSAGASETRFYLSSNFLFDSGDVLLGGRTIGLLAAGAEDTSTTAVLIPTTTPAGSYYVIARADAAGVIAEASESNNNRFKGLLKIGADLVVSALTTPGSAAAGGTIAVTDTTANTGTGDAGASQTRFYLSANFLLDTNDVLLGERGVSPLAAGAGDTATTTVSIPAGTLAGSYYVLAQADGTAVIAEASESNNVTFRGSVKIGPDLIVSDLILTSTAPASGVIDVTDTTTNAGTGDAGASETRFYLSTNSTLSADDALLGGRSVGALAAGAGDTATTTMVIPASTPAGSYYVLAQADATGVVVETSESNNNRFTGLVSIGADLSVSNLTIPGTAAAGGTIDVTDTTANNGASSAGASETRFYLSTNFLFDSGDVLLGGRTIGLLAAGAEDTATTTVLIPTTTPAGSYYVIARADAAGGVAEVSESNNNRFKGRLQLGADLVVSALTTSGSAAAGGTIHVTDTTANTGTGDAGASETRFYLSANFLLDAGDVLLGARGVNPLAAGAVNTATTTMSIPAGAAAGSYYVLAQADGTAVIAEASESNNVKFRGSVKIGADLVVSSLIAPGTTPAGGAMDVTDTTANTGAGDAGTSETRFYLSTNSTVSADDSLLGGRSAGALVAGGGNTATTTVVIPGGTAAGSYYVLAQADGAAAIAEASETNNVRFRAVTVTVPLEPPPPNLSAVAGDAQVSLSWTPSAGSLPGASAPNAGG